MPSKHTHDTPHDDFCFILISQKLPHLFKNPHEHRILFVSSTHNVDLTNHLFTYRTNGFYVWFPTILNSLANHDGGETKICDVLDASRVPVGNGTEVSVTWGKISNEPLRISNEISNSCSVCKISRKRNTKSYRYWFEDHLPYVCFQSLRQCQWHYNFSKCFTCCICIPHLFRSSSTWPLEDIALSDKTAHCTYFVLLLFLLYFICVSIYLFLRTVVNSSWIILPYKFSSRWSAMTQWTQPPSSVPSTSAWSFAACTWSWVSSLTLLERR